MTGVEPNQLQTRPWWRRWWVIALGVLAVLAAIGAATSEPENAGEDTVAAERTTTTAEDPTTTTDAPATTTRQRPTTTTEQRPGNAEVYARIEAMTDCADLQEQFDIAMDSAERRQSGDPLRTASLAYAEAADERMKKLDCY